MMMDKIFSKTKPCKFLDGGKIAQLQSIKLKQEQNLFMPARNLEYQI